MANLSSRSPAAIERNRFPPASDLDWLRRQIMGARMSDGGEVQHYDDGMVIPISPERDFLAEFGFGWRGPRNVDGERHIVRVNGGPVQGRTTTAWVDDTDVYVGGDNDAPHILYAFGTINPFTAQISATTTPESTWTGHDETYWRRPLYLCWLVNGVAVRAPVAGIFTLGCIDLRTWFN